MPIKGIELIGQVIMYVLKIYIFCMFKLLQT